MLVIQANIGTKLKERTQKLPATGGPVPVGEIRFAGEFKDSRFVGREVKDASDGNGRIRLVVQMETRRIVRL